MEQIKEALNLSADASEADVIAAIQQLQLRASEISFNRRLNEIFTGLAQQTGTAACQLELEAAYQRGRVEATLEI